MEKRTAREDLKRQNFVKRMILACSLAIVVVLAGIGTTNLTRHLEGESTQVSKNVQNVTEDSKGITLLMVGDNLLHMPIINDAETESGTYNFDGLYEKMSPYFQEADLSVIVQETILGGSTFEYSGYPLFNSPQEVGDAIAKAGFDVVLHATNHALDKGAKGVSNTLEFWKKYPNIKVLGIHESQEAYDTVQFVEKNGIKIALLNYTESTNGIDPPKDKTYIINRADREKIANDLKIAEESADFTVVFMHWGTEYRFDANENQKELAQFMTENGADLIMGSHPHVVEPAEWIEAENGNKCLVYYSLGNYVSRQKEVSNLVGAMGQVKICSSEDRGTYIESASVVPIVTHYDNRSRNFSVYPLKDYTDELAAYHGVAQYDGKVDVARLKKIFDDVFAGSSAVSIEG